MRLFEKISVALNLDSIKNRKWTIIACSALNKDGLNEGLDWIISNVNTA